MVPVAKLVDDCGAVKNLPAMAGATTAEENPMQPLLKHARACMPAPPTRTPELSSNPRQRRQQERQHQRVLLPLAPTTPGLQSKFGGPDPGPRSSDDQGIYLVCRLPAQNIRPSHSPSTWARPAPPRRPGQAISFRASHVCPIQPVRPARTTHARSNLAFGACILRGHERQVARPVARRWAARPTGPPMARSCGARRHLPSCGSEHQRPPWLCRVLVAFLFGSPSGDADGTGAYDTNTWSCDQKQRPVR